MNCKNPRLIYPDGVFGIYQRSCGKCTPCLAEKAASAILTETPLTDNEIEKWAEKMAGESIDHGEEK